MDEIGFHELAVADVLEHRRDVGGPAFVVADQRHHRTAPHQRAIVAPKEMLEMAPVDDPRDELLESFQGQLVGGLEVVEQQLAV